jgi:hypothetical protein
LQRLTVLRKNHADEQYTARLRVRQLPEIIEQLGEQVSQLEADRATADEHAADPVTIGSRACGREAVLEALGEKLAALPERVGEPRKLPVGVFRGLRFGLVLHPQFPPEVYLEGQTHRRLSLSKDHQGPRAVLNAAERITHTYQEWAIKAEEERTLCEDQLRDYTARLGAAFPHEAYYAVLTDLRDRLRAALSVTAPDADAGTIAGDIIALKQSQTVARSPERIGARRPVDAATPISLRVRERGHPETATGVEPTGVRPRRAPANDGWSR